MSEKRIKKEIAVKEYKFLSTMPFESFCEYVEELKARVPEEYMAGAKISITEPGEVGGDCHIIVSYKRLETDEENAKRDGDDEAKQEAKRNKKKNELIALAAEYPEILTVNPDCLEA